MCFTLDIHWTWEITSTHTAHAAEKRDQDTVLSLLCSSNKSYAPLHGCSGLSGKEGRSTCASNSQTVLQVSHQWSKERELNTWTRSISRSFQVLAAQRAQVPGITVMIFFYFFLRTSLQQLSLTQRLTAIRQSHSDSKFSTHSWVQK